MLFLMGPADRVGLNELRGSFEIPFVFCGLSVGGVFSCELFIGCAVTGLGIVGDSTPWLGSRDLGGGCSRHLGSRVPSLQKLIWFSIVVCGRKPPGITLKPPGTILKTSGGRGKKFPRLQFGREGSQGRASFGNRPELSPTTFGWRLRVHSELKGEILQTILEQSGRLSSMRHLS